MRPGGGHGTRTTWLEPAASTGAPSAGSMASRATLLQSPLPTPQPLPQDSPPAPGNEGLLGLPSEAGRGGSVKWASATSPTCPWLAGSVTPGLVPVLGGHPPSSGGGAETGVGVAGRAAAWGQSEGLSEATTALEGGRMHSARGPAAHWALGAGASRVSPRPPQACGGSTEPGGPVQTLLQGRQGSPEGVAVHFWRTRGQQ